MSAARPGAVRTGPVDPKVARPPRPLSRRQWQRQRQRRRRWQLVVALLPALLIHGLVLSLSFGGDAPGFPGFGAPWGDRRAETPELRVRLVPPRAPAPAELPAESPADAPTVAAPPAALALPPSVPLPLPRTVAAPAPATDTPPPAPAAAAVPAVIAVDRPELPTWTVPPAPQAPPAPTPVAAPVLAAASSASSPQPPVVALAEALRLEIEREEAERQEAERQAAVRLQQARQEAREAMAQAEAARLEAARQTAARQEAARLEAARQEAERQEAAARQRAAQQLAAQQEEAARQAAAQAEARRQEAARAEQEAARVRQATPSAEERREAVLRAIGRQLDEEAAQRKAAVEARALPGTLPAPWTSARRGRLFGRTDPNTELVLYAEAWARKIQLNPTFEIVREAAKRPHTHPIVTVALRRDGSVESVAFVVSSGVAEIDEAVRRIVQSQAPYPAFSPALAREFDVVEIRRSWYFDTAVRLY